VGGGEEEEDLWQGGVCAGGYGSRLCFVEKRVVITTLAAARKVLAAAAWSAASCPGGPRTVEGHVQGGGGWWPSGQVAVWPGFCKWWARRGGFGRRMTMVPGSNVPGRPCVSVVVHWGMWLVGLLCAAGGGWPGYRQGPSLPVQRLAALLLHAASGRLPQWAFTGPACVAGHAWPGTAAHVWA
jgi:hypothetical protein